MAVEVGSSEADLIVAIVYLASPHLTPVPTGERRRIRTTLAQERGVELSPKVSWD